MKRLLTALCGVTAIAAPHLALAQTYEPAGTAYYVQGTLGLTVLGDYDLDTDQEVNGQSLVAEDVTHEFGANIAASVGSIIPLGAVDLRVEGEISYRGNAIDEVDTEIAGEGDANGGSSTSALSGMANAHVDFEVIPNVALSAGAGIGYSRITLDLVADFDGNDDVAVVDDESDNVFAYQFMLGARYKLDQTSTISFGYQYFVAQDPKFEIPGNGEDYDAEYAAHNFNVGYAYHF